MRDHRRFAAIDQGNTLLKLTLLEGAEVKEFRRFSPEATEDVIATLEQWGVECGAFCSVGKLDPRLLESLRLSLDGRLLVVSRYTPVPLKVVYATPETLGLDRIVLAAGAGLLYPGEAVAVGDAGTAVTLDVIDGSPAFLGGRITAGMRLRFESLRAQTASLPLADPDGPVAVVGDSTLSAIRSGVVMGLADEITEAFRQYQERYGCRRLLLTGGDSYLLSEYIQTRIPVDLVPDLMAFGLLHIYNYNEI